MAMDLDESPPTIVENRMGKVGDRFNLTVPKVSIHQRQHADRILARVSGVAIEGKPIVKVLGDRAQQW